MNGSLTVSVLSEEVLARLLGTRDEILMSVEERLGLRLVVRGSDIIIPDDDPAIAAALADLLGQFAEMIRRGNGPSLIEIRCALDLLASGEKPDLLPLLDSAICVNNRGKIIRPYTQGQKEYVDAINSNDVVFAIGPAGTGKTYLAVAVAVSILKASRINRIVLVRPVVDAGERLGYLPGDLMEKIDEAVASAIAPHIPPNAAKKYNTEAPGMAVDRMSIMALKIFHMREQTRRTDAGDEHVNRCLEKLSQLTEQRIWLRQSIFDLIDDFLAGRKSLRGYFQHKMYNDKNLNPELYKKP